MKIIIYEHFEHFFPTGLGWGTGFMDLGHQVAFIKKTKFSIEDFPPADMLIYFDVPNETAEIDKIKQYKDRNPECKIIGIAMFPKIGYDKYLNIVDFWCGLAYKHLYAEKLFRDMGFRYYNIPMATDKKLFFPIVGSKKIFDVSFIGTFGKQGHGDRDEKYYLYPVLEDEQLIPYYSGFSWKGSPIINTNPEDLNIIYNHTKVNLNFHYPFEKEETPDNAISRIDLNSRLFDIALSGNFQLCDHPFVKDVFMGSVVVGDKENWMDLIYYYKDKEEERRYLAKMSRKIALKYHTWDKRMQLIIDIIEKK